MSSGNSSSSEESDTSQPPGSCKSDFRVSVCLRRYFSDVRARAYVLARRERSVGWLQRRLRRTFRLRGAFCLRAHEHLLPPGEPLRLLRADDVVEVIPLEEAQTEIQIHEHSIKQINGEKTEQKTVTSTSVYVGSALDAHTDEPDAAPGVELAAAPGGDARALQSLKRRALELLDERFGPDATEPPRRRRRVRRRTRRVAPSPPASRTPTPPPPPPPAHTRCAPTPPPAPQPLGDVAQNEAACARRPRMVHSLNVDNTVII